MKHFPNDFREYHYQEHKLKLLRDSLASNEVLVSNY